MRFFHLSDLHIGLKLMGRDLREDQEYILNEIIRITAQEKPDAMVIAGDIYDKAVPGADAVELFDAFVSHLHEAVPGMPVMMISGNHDSAPRLDCFRRILSREDVYMIGQPPRREGEHIARVTLEDAYGPVHFYLLPFVRPSMVKAVVGTDENGSNLSYDASLRRLLEMEEIDSCQRNVLVSHQFYLPEGKDADQVERTDSEIRIAGNIDAVRADVLDRFDYAALGHIHKPMKVGSECRRYCGTPLACSVSEAGQSKGIILVEMGEKSSPVKTRVIPLLPLRQIRRIRGCLPQVLDQACTDYVSLTLCDEAPAGESDLQQRLAEAFPRLLEVRRENQWQPDYAGAQAAGPVGSVDPFALCSAFLGEMDEEEKDILRDVISSVQEVKLR